MGYALQVTAMNQPFGFPDEYNGNLTTNPDNLTFRNSYFSQIINNGYRIYVDILKGENLSSILLANMDLY